MAKIAKKQNRKGTPPKMEEASSNLTNLPKKAVGIKKDLNFKVNADFKKQFKQYATERDLSMHDLLVQIFEFYETNNR